MKQVYKIRPEWIPNAYKDDASPITATGVKEKGSGQTLLYPHKKTLLKSRISKACKKG